MSRANGFCPVRAENGGLVATELIQLGASQTCLKGFALVRNSSNPEQADVATASDTSILGVAAANRTSGASPGDDDYIAYYPASNNTIFGGIADAAIAESQIGDPIDLVVDTSGATDRFLVDVGASATDIIRIVNLPRLGIAPSNLNNEREVHFKFVNSQWAQSTETA